MALLSDAKILLLEEPCIGLDKKNKKLILSLIKEICCRYQKQIIISTTSFEEALLVSSNIAWMKDGEIGGTCEPITLRN
jgi:ABC-type multidrug transport system ATPase subunit